MDRAQSIALARREDIRRLLADVEHLDRMLETSALERGVTRIGAEQELFVVDDAMRAAPAAIELLSHAKEPRLTTELARFDLEANATPRLLQPDGLRRLHDELGELVRTADAAADHVMGGGVVMAGILPSLTTGDLTLDRLTPYARYLEFDALLARTHPGGPRVVLEGVDELDLVHPNIMMQACNNSFQVHLQIDPEHAARELNHARLASGPVLAACCNSPVFLGRRLWAETRIGLFARAAESRTIARRIRGASRRVSFGHDWARGSAADIIRRSLATHPVVLTEAAPRHDGPLELAALRRFIGTTYDWNRLCYGVTDGIPHLRIETRVLPSGPSVVDEVANAALLLGLLLDLRREPDVTQRIPFAAVRRNFITAAREGLRGSITWLDGRIRPAADLVLDVLLPRAERGLADAGTDPIDVRHYLGVVGARVRRGSTGAAWLGDALEHANPRAVVSMLARLQRRGEPCHEWPPCRGAEPLGCSVEDVMRRDVPSVRTDDPIELATALASWTDALAVAVEDEDGRLIGIVEGEALRRTGCAVGALSMPAVCIAPRTSEHAAREILRTRGREVAAVVERGRLLGFFSTESQVGRSSKSPGR